MAAAVENWPGPVPHHGSAATAPALAFQIFSLWYR